MNPLPENIKITQLKLKGNQRFVIINSETGEMIDDANGYGFKSYITAKHRYDYLTNVNNGTYKDKKTLMKENKKLFEEYPELKEMCKNYGYYIFDSVKHQDEVHPAHLRNSMVKYIRENIPLLYEKINEDESFKNRIIKFVQENIEF